MALVDRSPQSLSQDEVKIFSNNKFSIFLTKNDLCSSDRINPQAFADFNGSADLIKDIQAVFSEDMYSKLNEINLVEDIPFMEIRVHDDRSDNCSPYGRYDKLEEKGYVNLSLFEYLKSKDDLELGIYHELGHILLDRVSQSNVLMWEVLADLLTIYLNDGALFSGVGKPFTASDVVKYAGLDIETANQLTKIAKRCSKDSYHRYFGNKINLNSLFESSQIHMNSCIILSNVFSKELSQEGNRLIAKNILKKVKDHKYKNDIRNGGFNIFFKENIKDFRGVKKIYSNRHLQSNILEIKPNICSKTNYVLKEDPSGVTTYLNTIDDTYSPSIKYVVKTKSCENELESDKIFKYYMCNNKIIEESVNIKLEGNDAKCIALELDVGESNDE